ncbi:MAG: carboxypeptidase-like regulatory domain-containing protein, partial [Tannerella sp.]|nr:carboxypeptidase-like regulatory domain-containing protein [Tannerella sp.]
MKTTLLFICIGIGLCFAENAYSQNTYLSIEVENGLVKDVFKEIEKKSDFLIFYYDGVVDVNRRVSINVKNQTVNNILDRMFEGTDNAYVINNRQIFIIRKQMPKAEITAMISQQQNRVWISGTIVDSEGEAIIGANIVEKGTTNGGITDADGKFSLNVSPGATIIVSYVGYQTQEISIGKQTSFTISLKEGNLALEEVVV